MGLLRLRAMSGPALHALTVSYTYDGVVSGQMAALLRAYVDDVAQLSAGGAPDRRVPAGFGIRAEVTGGVPVPDEDEDGDGDDGTLRISGSRT